MPEPDRVVTIFYSKELAGRASSIRNVLEAKGLSVVLVDVAGEGVLYMLYRDKFYTISQLNQLVRDATEREEEKRARRGGRWRLRWPFRRR